MLSAEAKGELSLQGTVLASMRMTWHIKGCCQPHCGQSPALVLSPPITGLCANVPSQHPPSLPPSSHSVLGGGGGGTKHPGHDEECDREHGTAQGHGNLVMPYPKYKWRVQFDPTMRLLDMRAVSARSLLRRRFMFCSSNFQRGILVAQGDVSLKTPVVL